MEHNQFAVFEQTIASDHSSLEDNLTVITVSQSDQVIPERGLSDPARFKDKILEKEKDIQQEDEELQQKVLNIENLKPLILKLVSNILLLLL